MSKTTMARYNMLYWSVMVANIFSPTLYAAELGYGNLYSYSHGGVMPGPWFNPVYLTTKYTIGLEQLVSGIFVIIAVVLIRKFLLGHGMESQVNYHKLGAQALLFVFYSISIVIFYYYLALYMSTEDEQTVRRALLAWIVTTYMNFFVQLAMIVIFMQLKSKRTNPGEETTPHDIITETDDQSANVRSYSVERISDNYYSPERKSERDDLCTENNEDINSTNDVNPNRMSGKKRLETESDQDPSGKLARTSDTGSYMKSDLGNTGRFGGKPDL